MQKIVFHTIEPYCDACSRVLILGSMPSPKSRESGFYYGHPQNRFWAALAGVWHEAVPVNIEEKKLFLSRHNIALWDVLHSCRISGAEDSSIADPTPNEIARLLKEYPHIKTVFTTGKTAFRLYNKLCYTRTGISPYYLPSPSAANRGAYPLPSLVETYSLVRTYADLT